MAKVSGFRMIVSPPPSIDSKQIPQKTPPYYHSNFLSVPLRRSNYSAPVPTPPTPEERKHLAKLNHLTREVLKFQSTKTPEDNDPANLSQVLDQFANVIDENPESLNLIEALEDQMQPAIASAIAAWQDEEWLTDYLDRTPTEHGEALQKFLTQAERRFKTRIEDCTEKWVKSNPLSQEAIARIQELTLAGYKAEFLNRRFLNNELACKNLISQAVELLEQPT